MNARQAELRQLQALIAQRKPEMHTWRPRGARNDLVISIWILTDMIAKATGRSIENIKQDAWTRAHLLAGDHIALSRATREAGGAARAEMANSAKHSLDAEPDTVDPAD